MGWTLTFFSEIHINPKISSKIHGGDPYIFDHFCTKSTKIVCGALYIVEIFACGTVHSALCI